MNNWNIRIRVAENLMIRGIKTFESIRTPKSKNGKEDTKNLKKKQIPSMKSMEMCYRTFQ